MISLCFHLHVFALQWDWVSYIPFFCEMPLRSLAHPSLKVCFVLLLFNEPWKCCLYEDVHLCPYFLTFRKFYTFTGPKLAIFLFCVSFCFYIYKCFLCPEIKGSLKIVLIVGLIGRHWTQVLVTSILRKIQPLIECDLVLTRCVHRNYLLEAFVLLYFYCWHYDRCPHLTPCPLPTFTKPCPPSLWPSPLCCLYLWVIHISSLY